MFKSTSMILGAALLAALSLTAGEADAADTCVPPKVIAALADCSVAPSSARMPVADLLAAAAKLQSRASGGNLPGNKSKGSRKGPLDRLAPRELDDAEKKVEGDFHRFLCDDKPAPGDAKATEQHVEIAYALGRLYFGANHFAEASVVFGDIALHRADTSVGIYASQLYLEALNVLGSAGATSCYDDMARDVPAFIGLYCKDGKEKVNAEQCGVLGMIQRDILRLQAEQRIEEGDRGGADGLDGSAAYEAGALIYLQIWEQYGRPACEARSPSCARSEEILYNAARAYQGARKIDKAIAVRKALIDPRYHLDTTELARKAHYEIGGNYHAMAIYDEAATWYESFARKSPMMEKAPEALTDAIVMRLALGQRAQAEADAGDFNKVYGSKKPVETAKIAFAVASDALDRGDHEGARKRFEAAMAMFDKSDSIDLQIKAHAGLGRALAALHKDPQAAAEYGKVRALHRDPAGVIAKMARASGGLDDRALGRVLTAVGEAIFFFAEEKRRAAEAIRLPIYAGTGRREDVAAYTSGPLATWLAQRRTAIGDAEKAYAEALAIQPLPPPKWEVASAARVAQMHGKLAAQLLTAPLPKSWKSRGPSPWGPTWEAVRADFRGALEQASDPLLARAKAAYRSCVDLSVKYQYIDDRARSCGAWLSRRYPSEFPRLDEIIDRPSHRYFAIERGLPVGRIKLDP
jgi:tetratricopeptide (TPR) repeat protein